MRYGLLFADIAALLLGLVGLAALVSFAALIEWQIAYANGRLHLFVGFFVMMAVMTLVYLVPPLNQRILRTTFPWPARLLFVGLSVCWLFFSLSYLRQLAGLDIDLRDHLQAHYGWVVGGTAALFALLIFPVGIGYGELRAERRAAREAALAAEAVPHHSLAASHVPQVGAPRLVRHEAAPAAGRQGGGSKAGAWSNLLGFPLVAVCAYAYFAGRTSQTAELDALLHDYMIPGIGALTVLAWIFGVLRWKTHVARLRRIGKGPGAAAIGLFLGIPTFLAVLYFAIGFYAFPLAWNLATENPTAERIYTVVSVDRTRKRKGCMKLAYDSHPDRTTEMCLGRAFGLSQSPGTRLVIRGELSAFGHTMDEIGVLGR